MKKIFSEPMLHFVLLGGVIFLLFQLVSNDTLPDNAEIVVTNGQIKALESGFEKVWQRSPDVTELNALIQNHIKEEIMYREAISLGLDKNDGIVRRRMSQKLKFLSEDMADLSPADDKALQAYLNEHVDRYTKSASYGFRQIYFSATGQDQDGRSRAASLLSELRNGKVDDAELGDPIMIPYQVGLRPETDIKSILGAEFAQALRGLPVQSWQGPVESGFGYHLVFVDQKISETPPVLDEVRKQVGRDWSADRRKAMNQSIYEELKQRYTVTIEAEMARGDADRG